MNNPGDFAGELLKALRARWLSVEELMQELRCSEGAVRSWLASLQVQGLVESRVGDRRDRRGNPPLVYALTKPWGGIA